MGDYDLHIGIYGDDSNFTSAMSRTRDQVRKTAREVEKSGMSIEQMFNRIKIAAAGALAGFSVKEFASKVVQVRGEFQQLEVAFTTMLGSAEKAKSLMEQLTATAAKTPFDLQGVTQGAKQLLAYGVAAEDVNDTLIHLGDIAAGLSIPLGDLVYLYGTTMTQGRMFTQDLRQFMGRGIPLAEELAKQFGVTKDKVQELVSTGKVGAKEFNQAIMSMSSEGGKFYGLMENQSKTITGQISNIEDAIDNMFNEIGQKSEGIINGALSAVSLLVENYEKVGKAILFVVATYGEYKAAIMVNIALEKAQAFNRLASTKGMTAMQLATDILTKKTAALNAVLMANPYVLLAAAVMSAATAYVLFRNKTDEVSEAQKRLNDIKDEAAEKVEEEKDKIEELRRVAMSEQWTLAARQDAIKKLNALIPNYNAQLDATSGKYRENKAALDDYLVSLARKYELEGAKDQLRQIGKEIAQTRLEIAKAKENVAGTKSLQGNVGKMSAYNPAESQFLVANTSRAEKDLDDANKRLSVKLQERKLIYDTFGEEIVKDVVAGQGLDPMSNNPKGGGGKKGSTGVNKEDITAQQILLDRELEERRSKARIDAANAAREAYIASIQDNASREMAQEKFEHEKRIQEIGAQAVEMKKARYEAEKKQWELTNKGSYETGSDAGKAGWMGVSLSDDEMVLIQAQLEKENAEYNRAMQERSQSLIAAHQSYTDQKLAIDRTYNDEVVRINDAIRQAEQRGDTEMVEALKRSLGEAAKERAKAQGELSLNILKKSPEYVRAFEDLQKTSSETLELLISQFEEAKEAAAQSMDPKDLREFTDTLQQMYDELDSRDPWKAMKSSLEEVKAAHREVIKAERDLKVIQSGGIVTVRVYDKELDKFVDTVVTEEEAMRKVAEAKDKEAKANTKYRKASKEAKEVIDDLAAAIQNVGGAIGGIAGEIISLIGDVTSVVNGALHAMENTSQCASAAIQAAEKASAILAIISAAIQIIQKISGLVKNLFGANDAKDYEKAKQRYENLVSIWDEMIEKKREYLNESWGKEVMGAEEEARALLKIEEEQIRLLAQQRLKVTNGSHSMWYRMWKGSYKFNGQNWQDVAGEISRTLNVTFNSMEDMTNMTSEQLQWIKENYVGLWSVMDGDFREHLEKIISFAKTEKDIIDETMERMTTTGADSVFDDFMDSLYELADGSEDVMQDIADNWQKMVNRMVINNLIGESMRADLKDWYNQLYEVNKRRVTDSLSDEQYKEELDRLSALYNSYVENGKQQIEQLSDMGIIKSIAETEEEVEEETRGYLDSIRNAYQQLISDSEIDVEKWSKDMRNTILRNLMESKLLDEAFDKWATDWSDRYAKLLSDMTDKSINQQEFDDMMKELMAEFDQKTGEIADKSKMMWEAFGFDEEQAKEAEEVVEGAFKDLHSSFLSTLTDMKDDAEAWSKQITKTMVEQMVERNILGETFDKQMDEWRERFENAVTAGDTEGLKALRKELEEIRGSLAEQAHAYMEALGYVEDVVDNVKKETEHAFSNLSDTLVSSVMDLDKSAEEVGRDIGKTLVEQMIKQMVESKYAKRIESIQKMWDGVLNGTSKNTINSVKREILRLYKAIGNETKELTDDLREIIEEEMEDVNLFDNLHSSLLSFLTDAGQDIDSFINDLRKNITSQLIDEFVLEGLDEQMALWNAEMKKIMSLGGSPEQIAKDAKELTDQIAAYSESKKKEAEMWNQMMGVDNTDYGDQKASVNMADKATYDQFELFLGMQTAMMIGQEQGNAVRVQILNTLQAMGGITSPNSGLAEQLRNMMMLSNEYLLDIKRSNREMLDSFGVKLDSINSKLSRL